MSYTIGAKLTGTMRWCSIQMIRWESSNPIFVQNFRRNRTREGESGEEEEDVGVGVGEEEEEEDLAEPRFEILAGCRKSKTSFLLSGSCRISHSSDGSFFSEGEE